jgi:hypothetical protein
MCTCQSLSTHTWPTLLLERIFIESFLYNCTVLTVQEKKPTLTSERDASQQFQQPFRVLFDLHVAKAEELANSGKALPDHLTFLLPCSNYKTH